LHRAAHLAAVHTHGHNGAKGAHVKEVLAHPFAGLAHLIGAALAFVFGGFFLLIISCCTFCSGLRLFFLGYSQI